MVRFKNRYLLCVIEHDSYDNRVLENVVSRSIISVVRTSVQKNFGDVTAGKLASSLAIKFWSPALGLALIRTSRDNFRETWAAVSMIDHLDSSIPETVQIRFRVIHVGGTIRSCQKSAVEYSRKILLESPHMNRSEVDTAIQTLNAVRN